MKHLWPVQLVSILFVAICVGTGWRVVSINSQFAENVKSAPAHANRAQRAVYPFSVIPGGVESSAEIEKSIRNDAVVAKHYGNLVPGRFIRRILTRDTLGYVSYRVGNEIYWTTHQVTIKAGEAVLTDGNTVIRARCGNLIALNPPSTPSIPPRIDPPEVALDTPMTPSGPSATPSILTTAPPLGPEGPIIPSGPVIVPDQSIPTGGSEPPLLPPSGGGGGCGEGPIIFPPIVPGSDSAVPPISPVPEPGSIIMVGTGLAALGAYARKRRNSRGHSSGPDESGQDAGAQSRAWKNSKFF